MAPELFSPTGISSFQSDLWSLGCLLYEFAAGAPPFNSKSLNTLITAIVNDKAAPLPNYSADFNDLLSQLLQKAGFIAGRLEQNQLGTNQTPPLLNSTEPAKLPDSRPAPLRELGRQPAGSRENPAGGRPASSSEVRQAAEERHKSPEVEYTADSRETP